MENDPYQHEHKHGFIFRNMGKIETADPWVLGTQRQLALLRMPRAKEVESLAGAPQDAPHT